MKSMMQQQTSEVRVTVGRVTAWVESDGTIRVYDPVAGHRTIHHGLSSWYVARISSAARDAWKVAP